MKTFEDYEKMAMFELSDEERTHLNKRFTEIIDSFSALDAYDTDGIEPLVTVLDENTVLREDIVVKSFTAEEILENAPDKHDFYFRVPSI